MDPLVSAVEASRINVVVDGTTSKESRSALVALYERSHSGLDLLETPTKTVQFRRPLCACRTLAVRFFEPDHSLPHIADANYTIGHTVLLVFQESGDGMRTAAAGSGSSEQPSRAEPLSAALARLVDIVRGRANSVDGPMPVALLAIAPEGTPADAEHGAPVAVLRYDERRSAPLFRASAHAGAECNGAAVTAAVSFLVSEALRIRRNARHKSDAAEAAQLSKVHALRTALPQRARRLLGSQQLLPLPPCTCGALRLNSAAPRWRCTGCLLRAQRKCYCACPASAVRAPWCAPWPTLRLLLLGARSAAPSAVPLRSGLAGAAPSSLPEPSPSLPLVAQPMAQSLAPFRLSQPVAQPAAAQRPCPFGLLPPDLLRLVAHALHESYWEDFIAESTRAVHRILPKANVPWSATSSGSNAPAGGTGVTGTGVGGGNEAAVAEEAEGAAALHVHDDDDGFAGAAYDQADAAPVAPHHVQISWVHTLAPPGLAVANGGLEEWHNPGAEWHW